MTLQLSGRLTPWSSGAEVLWRILRPQPLSYLRQLAEELATRVTKATPRFASTSKLTPSSRQSSTTALQRDSVCPDLINSFKHPQHQHKHHRHVQGTLVLENATVALRRSYALVPRKWYEQWSAFVDLQQIRSEHLLLDAYSPGPVDNSKLVQHDGSLKPGLTLDDVGLIDLQAWEAVCTYYPQSKKHELIRPVILDAQGNKVVELYPVKVHVITSCEDVPYFEMQTLFPRDGQSHRIFPEGTPKSELDSITMGLYWTIEEMKACICRAGGLDADATEIFHFAEYPNLSMTVFRDDTQTLADMDLQDAVILVNRV